MNIITARGIHKHYNKGRSSEVHVLNGIDLELPAAGLVCLLGESGSGKTTLLNALGRLDHFGSGTQTMEGVRLGNHLNGASERLRNRLFGYVFQDYFLLEDATVRENLRLSLHGCGLTQSEEDERIDYVLRAVDMYAYRKRQVDMLSGGQRQRVAIARALVKSPSVIFADEPTGNLDEARTMQIMNILRRISSSCLVLLATHERELAEVYADRIIIIRDGKIADDRNASPEATYRLTDDNALYLDEYRHTDMKAERVCVDYYANTDESISLTVVRERGRLYISAPDGISIEAITPTSAVRFKAGPRPILDREVDADFTFDLPHADVQREAFNMTDLWHTARHALFSAGRKLAVPYLVLAITAALAAISVADWLTLSDPNVQSFITTDSRYLEITVETTGAVSLSARTETMRELLTEMEQSAPEHLLWMPHSTDLTYGYEGFTQINQQTDEFASQTVVPLELFDEADLVFGRMPVAPNEIIMDRWILENFMQRETTLSKSIPSITHFLGQSLAAPRKSYILNIVGICDSNQPAIYIDRTAGLSFCSAGVGVASLASLRAAYPGQYDDVVLAVGECLVNASRLNAQQLTTFHHRIDYDFAVKGSFPEEFPAEFVIDSEDADALSVEMAAVIRTFCVFTDDKEAFKAWLSDGISPALKNTLHIRVKDTYAERFAARMATINTQLRSRTLIMGATAVMALAVLYIVMNANARANIHAIAVYRLIGIRKGTLLVMYALWFLFLASLTALPIAFVTAGVLALLSQIRLLNLNFIVSLPATALAALGVIAINIFVGLAPIARMLRMPPAKLAAPYDI